MNADLEKSMNAVINKDLCKKVRDDTRAIAVRTAMLVNDPLSQSLIFTEAARELMVAASAALCFHFQKTLTPRQAISILNDHMKDQNESLIKGIEETLNGRPLDALFRGAPPKGVIEMLMKALSS